MILGILDALPIAMGYFPYAFAFGILARQADFSFLQTLFMCLIVYAGSSQIIALGLLQAGQAVGAIVLATLIFNLRFALMSAALVPFLSGWSLGKRTIFGYQVADEPFALLSTKFALGELRPTYAFSVHMTAYCAWSLFSLLGFAASGFVPDVRPWGLDFALPAIFIGLLLCLIQNRLMIVVLSFSSLVAILMHLAGSRQMAVIVSSIGGASLGALIEIWMAKKSSASH